LAIFAAIRRASSFVSSFAAELKKAECRRCAVAQRVVPTHQIEFGKVGRLQSRARARLRVKSADYKAEPERD